VEDHDTPLCPVCEDTLLPLEPPLCSVCGVPFAAEGGGERPCGRCASSPPAFTAARAAWWYGGELETLLQRFKFGGRRELAGFLAGLACDPLPPGLGTPDLVVPVPLARPRLRRRGYDQAWLLAREVGRRLGLPATPRAVVRRRHTAPQTGLSAAARADNVRGAFSPGRADLAGRRVLLVDDVLTTGASAGAAAQALLDAGAASVAVLAVARAV